MINNQLITLIKDVKGISLFLKQFNKANKHLHNTATAVVPQPIELLFNWVIQLTNVRVVSLIRSESGLNIYVWGNYPLH